VVAAGTLLDQLGAALLVPARAAFTSGMHVVAAVSAVLLVGVAIVVLTQLRHIRPLGAAQPAENDEPKGVRAA
jgi:DHA2 family multidrug resistance protein-like MFS transporter